MDPQNSHEVSTSTGMEQIINKKSFKQWIFLFVCDCLHRSLNLFIILKDSRNFVNNTLPANSLKFATRRKSEESCTLIAVPQLIPKAM